MNESLMALALQKSQLEQLIIESNGEMTPELESQIAVNADSIALKADSYNNILEWCEHSETYYRSMAAKYEIVARSYVTLEKRLKHNIRETMLMMDSKEIMGHGVRFVLSFLKPKLEIFDEDKLPMSMLDEVVTHVPNKDRIRDALESGIEVSGARLIPTTSLRKYMRGAK
jgi:hypothetical protein